jgi:hypothetical protein
MPEIKLDRFQDEPEEAQWVAITQNCIISLFSRNQMKKDFGCTEKIIKAEHI